MMRMVVPPTMPRDRTPSRLLAFTRRSSIWVEKEDRRVNAKSLLGVLSLGIVKGTTITLIADGSDEKEAVGALVELVNDNFGE